MLECIVRPRAVMPATLGSEVRRTTENQKITCGQKRFETLGVNCDVVTSLSEVAM
jgi:type III restriction enzyme